MTYSAQQVADTIAFHAEARTIEIDPLKMQKLLYYAQAWFLVFFSEPLFEENIEAWVHGPVVRSVFCYYRDRGWNKITDSGTSIGDCKVVDHVSQLLDVYGGFTGRQLERLSHQESPWMIARGGLAPEVSSRAVITHESMNDFYLQAMNGQA